METFAGKVAVVTGGGSGIGRALSLEAGRRGMSVAVVDIDAGAAEAVAGELRGAGVRAIAAAVNVADRDSVFALARRVESELGGCDLLCNNAGIVFFRHPAEMTPADWDWVIDVDLGGVINGVQAFLPRMLARGSGHIVNTSSIAGLVAGASPLNTAYTAAKFGVAGFTEGLRLDLAGQGIGVSLLCPGAVRSRITASERNRPDAYGGPGRDDWIPGRGGSSPHVPIEPAVVAGLVFAAVEADELYIMTNPEARAALEARSAALAAAYDRLERALAEREPAP